MMWCVWQKSRARQKVTEKKLKELRVEHQLLLQIFDKVVTKAEQLLTNQIKSQYDLLKDSNNHQHLNISLTLMYVQISEMQQMFLFYTSLLKNCL